MTITLKSGNTVCQDAIKVLPDDVLRVINYKIGLENAIVYDPPKYKGGQTHNEKTTIMLQEVKNIERWLKWMVLNKNQ